MGETKHRVKQVANEFGIGVTTLLEFIQNFSDKKLTPNSKISDEFYQRVMEKFGSDKKVKEKIEEQKELESNIKEPISADDLEGTNIFDEDIQIVHDIQEEIKEQKSEQIQKTVEEKQELIEEKQEKAKINGPKVVGKIDLNKPKKEEKKEVKPEEIKEKEEKITEKKKDVKETIDETKKKEKKETSVETEKKEEKIIEKKKEEKEEKSQPEKKEQLKKEKIKKEEKKESEKKEDKHEKKQKKEEIKKEIEDKKEEDDRPNKIETKIPKLQGPTVVGSINLNEINMETRPKKKTKKEREEEKRKKQTVKSNNSQNKVKKQKDYKKQKAVKVDINKPEKYKPGKKKFKKKVKKDITITSEAEVQKKIKETLNKIELKSKKPVAKFKRDKRQEQQKKLKARSEAEARERSIIKVTEFMTVKELASLMAIQPIQIIEFMMDLGQPVTINYRLSSDLIKMVAEQFEFQISFVDNTFEEEIEKILSSDENKIEPRPPIVTVMGHVDHGKTSLLDYIRNTNVVSGEAGGITQHIGAYSVKLEKNKIITFIDTPGHEAFTAMRARGTSITDIAVIVVSAIDSVMPQTEEAIDHAKAAGVPIIFAINKMDKDGANPEKIRQQLAERNILVESWGGKYGDVEISAKAGTNIDLLLERIWLEAELLELKTNSKRNAIATVLESRLDKGRGYVSNIIIRTGTLKVGDIIVAGPYYGKVKAMYNELNKRQKSVGPSMPTQLLGLNGAPEPGDALMVTNTEKEAREKAEQRMQIIREMQLRSKRKLSLEEISRRFAEGEKIDLNFIVKADVKGSIDAITDQITKLSNEEVSVNVVRAAVGQISNSDVILASASQAVIISFNVRPSAAARHLAEENNVEIRTYSVIYNIINDIKDTVQGALKPEIKEEITGTAEVMEVFKITKVGTVAGCLVRDGKIAQNSKVRLIRDGVVSYTGKLSSLKRFKNDVKEVQKGYECGMSIENYNDIKVGDFIEAFTEIEVQREL